MLLNLLSVLLQVVPDVDFIGQMYKLSPIIGCLIIGIGFLLYLLKSKEATIKEKEALVKSKDDEIKELNIYTRESDAENIKILEKVSSTLDRVMEQEKNGNIVVLKEIDNLKQLILLKLKGD